MQNYKNFYKISKTLRFELKPVGKTLENIKKNQILFFDEHKAMLAKEVKLLLDEYYKIIIDDRLSTVKIEKKLLDEYLNNIGHLKELEGIKTKMKNNIISTFKINLKNDNDEEKNKTLISALTSKEVFSLLIEYLKDNNRYDDIKKIEVFNQYSTYFTVFF